MENQTFLSLEQVSDILPDKYKFSPSLKVERSIYQTHNDTPLAIVNSKLYPNNTYWFSSVTKYFQEKGIETICFVCGNEGILLIPIDIILGYNRYSGWKDNKKGRSYYVRVKQRGGKYLLYNHNDQSDDIDVSEYFISNL